jgi:hypothetical protein
VIAPEAWVLPGKTWPAATTHEKYMAALGAVEKGMRDPNEPLFTWGAHQFFHGVVCRKELDSISMTRPIVVWHRSIAGAHVAGGSACESNTPSPVKDDRRF